ncbi:hypothetical protein GCM10010102_39440 [Promicromonospora citrea]|uniref:Uncharacterized protein n=1 Tax=Promicromonospora citrea TaxID=43677 RepID=A0A8H9L7C6_9MICO|nr:hypothetical protein GCM10010102_39440 [Promicromonospora citrea]
MATAMYHHVALMLRVSRSAAVAPGSGEGSVGPGLLLIRPGYGHDTCHGRGCAGVRGTVT